MYAGVGRLHACTVPGNDNFEGQFFRLILTFAVVCAAMTSDKFESAITDSSERLHSWSVLAQGRMVIARRQGLDRTSWRSDLKFRFKIVTRMTGRWLGLLAAVVSVAGCRETPPDKLVATF